MNEVVCHPGMIWQQIVEWLQNLSRFGAIGQRRLFWWRCAEQRQGIEDRGLMIIGITSREVLHGVSIGLCSNLIVHIGSFVERRQGVNIASFALGLGPNFLSLFNEFTAVLNRRGVGLEPQGVINAHRLTPKGDGTMRILLENIFKLRLSLLINERMQK